MSLSGALLDTAEAAPLPPASLPQEIPFKDYSAMHLVYLGQRYTFTLRSPSSRSHFTTAVFRKSDMKTLAFQVFEGEETARAFLHSQAQLFGEVA
ncbi:hypothetical protein JDN40_14435 [Rhodomicrobium vannielii ATCC 17100]|uniref:hypothetical protein n=1 Tax=Rhodomicrobium vannielii TaxID=1069 RepID=UPI00191A7159|nr:hypothetical protein [Rhodomicrobium vannielii]MBJ7535306.1 hypothetical protein [Rhodomicrobium vannielii ATCC 17100]